MGFASTGVLVCCFVREQLRWLELGALADVPLGQSWSHHSRSSLIHGQTWVVERDLFTLVGVVLPRWGGISRSGRD